MAVDTTSLAGAAVSSQLNQFFGLRKSFLKLDSSNSTSTHSLFQNVDSHLRLSSENKGCRCFFAAMDCSGKRESLASMDQDVFDDASSTNNVQLTPLMAMANAFEELSAIVKTNGFEYDFDLKNFCDACSLVSKLFGVLGIAFKFAEHEYSSKVKDLSEASSFGIGTLNNVLDFDVQNDTVKSPGSLSRNLRRVKQGLDLIRAIFQNFLESHDSSLREAASTAYKNTCAAYHTWVVRTAAYAGMYALPTREQLLEKLNESDDSAKREMIRYIDASLPVIQYIDKLYSSRNISLDW